MAMPHVPGQPLRRTADQVRTELEKLRTKFPEDYAKKSAGLLRELERIESSRRRTALT